MKRKNYFDGREKLKEEIPDEHIKMLDDIVKSLNNIFIQETKPDLIYIQYLYEYYQHQDKFGSEKEAQQHAMRCIQAKHQNVIFEIRNDGLGLSDFFERKLEDLLIPADKEIKFVVEMVCIEEETWR